MGDGSLERLVPVTAERLFEARCLRADQVDRAHVRPDRRGERREVLGLRRAAEDQVHRLVGVRLERRQGRGHVRRLRIVDVGDPASLGDQLEPVRNARKGAERLGDRVVRDSGDSCSRSRSGRVLTVVPAADQRLGRQRIVGRERDPVEPEPCAERSSRGRARRSAASRRGRPRTCRGGRGGPARG